MLRPFRRYDIRPALRTPVDNYPSHERFLHFCFFEITRPAWQCCDRWHTKTGLPAISAGASAQVKRAASMDYDLVVIIQRSRQPLRSHHHHWRIVSRTSNRAGGSQCSGANPCSDTNQNQRSDSGGEQSSLAHANSPVHPARMQRSLIRSFGMCPTSQIDSFLRNVLNSALS
jgi:hypothetical protein